MESVGWFVGWVVAGVILGALVIFFRNKGECPPGSFAYVGGIIIVSLGVWIGLTPAM